MQHRGIAAGLRSGRGETLPFVVTHATRSSTTNDAGPLAASPATVLATAVTNPPVTAPTATTSAPVAPATTSAAPPAVTSSAPAQAAAPAPSPPAAATPTARAVTVQAGDTMWSLTASWLGPDATNAQIVAAWPTYYAQNRSVIGPDPSLLRPGEVLQVTV